jgi:hypothetical protein
VKQLDPEPREIDYRIRPAKNVERKMLLEICGRMAGVQPLCDYRYVGMGSIYFVDFSLFHRAFGMTSMISLEGRAGLMDRCDWNKPFDCIEVWPQTVAEALPQLVSDVPTIMWLDFEEPLDAAILGEVAEACEILGQRSILIATVNAQVGPLKNRVTRFRKRFGDRDLARVNKPEDLGSEKLRGLYHEYLDGTVDTAIKARSVRDGTAYRQIAYFSYKDGVEMLTLAWLLHGSDEDRTMDACGLDNLDFAETGAEPFRIEVPRLTYRERLELDKLLPAGKLDDAPDGVDLSDIEAYATLYRQMPIYVDALI